MVKTARKSPQGWGVVKRVLGSGLAGTTGAIALLQPAVMATDPFREGADARPLPPEVASALDTYMCQGNYAELPDRLAIARQAAPSEPTVYVALASLAYVNEDFDTVSSMTDQTLAAAAALKDSDPLRGELYEGVGYGMQAAVTVIDKGVAAGLPQALPDVTQMFSSLRAASAINPDDPEVNMVSGFINLLMTRRERALSQFSKASNPSYLIHRAKALTLRDLERYPEALSAVDLALESNCNNPELFYLKAQILRDMKHYDESVEFYNQALAFSEQLPESIVNDINKELERTENKLPALEQTTDRQALRSKR